MASAHFLQLFVVCAVSLHWLSRFCVLAAQGYASTLRLGAGQHTMRRADLITLTRLHHRKCDKAVLLSANCAWCEKRAQPRFRDHIPFRNKLSGRQFTGFGNLPEPTFFNPMSPNWNKFPIFRTSLLSDTRLLHLI